MAYIAQRNIRAKRAGVNLQLIIYYVTIIYLPYTRQNIAHKVYQIMPSFTRIYLFNRAPMLTVILRFLIRIYLTGVPLPPRHHLHLPPPRDTIHLAALPTTVEY